MVLHNMQDILMVCRRGLYRAALVCVAAVLLMSPTLGAMQGLLERFKEDVHEEIAYLLSEHGFLLSHAASTATVSPRARPLA